MVTITALYQVRTTEINKALQSTECVMLTIHITRTCCTLQQWCKVVWLDCETLPGH